MSLYDWLLFLHITGAFALIGGIVVAGILNFATISKTRRPSEIALLYRLVQPAVVAIGVGVPLAPAAGPRAAADAGDRPLARSRSAVGLQLRRDLGDRRSRALARVQLARQCRRQAPAR